MKTYRSPALAAAHETASDLRDAGLLSKRTLREFDDLCLTSTPEVTAAEIRAIRENARVSQSVFARYLNVTASLVSQWERGEKSPRGASLKLLALVRAKGLDAVA